MTKKVLTQIEFGTIVGELMRRNNDDLQGMYQAEFIRAIESMFGLKVTYTTAANLAEIAGIKLTKHKPAPNPPIDTPCFTTVWHSLTNLIGVSGVSNSATITAKRVIRAERQGKEITLHFLGGDTLTPDFDRRLVTLQEILNKVTGSDFVLTHQELSSL